MKHMGMIAGLLLLWFLLPAPVVLVESFSSPVPPGILDGDDDAITALSDLDVKILATIAWLPSEARDHVVTTAPVEADHPVLFAALLAHASRSPPNR